MITFIIAALTTDGFIAKNSAHISTEWTSKEDKQFFNVRTKQAGVVIMGKNTFNTVKKALPGRLNMIYSFEPIEGVEITQKEPKALLEELERRGFKEVAICGGSTIYTMFMQARVVDKLYLTFEPILFGEGMRLFNKEINAKLQLVATTKLGENTLLLEYNVIK